MLRLGQMAAGVNAQTLTLKSAGDVAQHLCGSVFGELLDRVTARKFQHDLVFIHWGRWKYGSFFPSAFWQAVS
jgi:hypothetical protein